MASGLERKAASYLSHMLVAAQVQDRSSGLWRNLLDNWHAYTRGHPFVAQNGEGQPIWFNRPDPIQKREMLLRLDGRSTLADEIMKGKRKGVLVVDHVVPTNLLRDMMIEKVAGWTSVGDVQYFLQTWYRLCVITEEEHRLLATKGFNIMSLSSDAIFKRYEVAGIKLHQAEHAGVPDKRHQHKARATFSL